MLQRGDEQRERRELLVEWSSLGCNDASVLHAFQDFATVSHSSHLPCAILHNCVIAAVVLDRRLHLLDAKPAGRESVLLQDRLLDGLQHTGKEAQELGVPLVVRCLCCFSNARLHLWLLVTTLEVR